MLDLKGCNREIILLRNRLINTEKVADSYKRKAKEAVKADSTCQQGLNNLTGQVKNLEKQNTNLTLVNKDLTKQADKGRIATLALGISTPILTIAAFIAGIFIAK